MSEAVLRYINNKIEDFKEFSRRAHIYNIYYNYFSKHVRCTNGGKLIIYKNTKVYFKTGARIVIDGGVLRLGGGKPLGAKNSSLFRILDGAEFYAYGNNTIEYDADLLLRKGAKFIMRKGAYINCKSIIRCTEYIEIGEYVISGTELDIRDSDGHMLNGVIKTNPIVIGNHVWIGARVTVLEGVRIGEGVVIGACSLVTNSVPAKCLAYGTPAKVRKEEVLWEF